MGEGSTPKHCWTCGQSNGSHLIFCRHYVNLQGEPVSTSHMLATPCGFHVQLWVPERRAWVHAYWSKDEIDARSHAVSLLPSVQRVRVLRWRSEKDQSVVWPPQTTAPMITPQDPPHD